jgi:hypothetical protein
LGAHPDLMIKLSFKSGKNFSLPESKDMKREEKMKIFAV